VRDDEAEIRGWFDGYLEVFGSLARGDRSDVEAVLPFFTVPMSTTSGRDHIVHMDSGQVVRAYASITHDLQDAGYDRSVADRVTIRVLNERAATVEGHGERLDKGGGRMSGFGGFFLVIRIDDAWRCTAVINLGE